MSEQPYAIETSTSEGRNLVASRTLQPGSEVLREGPLIAGPLCISELVCLGCHAPLKGDCFHSCSGCGWPLCGKACESHTRHAAECGVLRLDTRRIGVPNSPGETPKYDLILILRGLLLKKLNPAAWDQLMALENHADIWESDDDIYHKAPVRYFSNVCKVENDVSDIHKVRGALLTNCLVFKNEFGIFLRGIYPTYSLINHSCIPNIHTIISEEGIVQARAATTINKKSKMFVCYTGTTEPLWKRQEQLYRNYKFHCRCRRCTDPTDLGTYFSMPKCYQCAKGYICPSDDFEENWKCDMCEHSLSLSSIEETASQSIDQVKTSQPMELKESSKLSGKINDVIRQFHSSHYVTLEVTQLMLGKLKSYSDYGSLKLKKQMWEKQIKIIDKLEPGLTRRRGVHLLEFCKASVALAQVEARQGTLALADWQQEAGQLQTRLTESCQILALEPEGFLKKSWTATSQQLFADLENGGSGVFSKEV